MVKVGGVSQSELVREGLLDIGSVTIIGSAGGYTEREKRSVLENRLMVRDGVFNGMFEDFGATVSFAREEDADDRGVATHFFLTASNAAELANILLENSGIEDALVLFKSQS